MSGALRTISIARPFGPMLLAALVTTAGCADGMMNWDWGGGLGPKEGEPWTIACAELQGAEGRSTAESLAEALRKTSGIKPDQVRVEHRGDIAGVYYGAYYRKIERRTKRLAVTREMTRDMRLIKELGVPGRGHYFNHARFVPLPSPDVGNPEWNLDRASGAYTLRIAVFYNEPGFSERKEAAAEYAKALREQGYPAFYRHGPINSEVFVGEFSEGAVKPFESKARGGAVTLDVVSEEVKALQAKENFRYELWNLRRRQEMIGGKKVATLSRVVRIHEAQDEDPW